MYRFDHIGLPTDKELPNEIFEEAFGLYRTEATGSRLHIEYLRYTSWDDSIPLEMKTKPHVGYYVDNLDEAIKDMDGILFGPFNNGHEKLVYGTRDWMLFELIEKYN